ncbi:single-stranded-DNA-specific exonuclease RecJ [Algicella marina]|uniref:Single-stranded-DNA-specific exonuclease RecJ n=1 Tax=Algicella marina TaxID=2683284 RepID=A0A6P1SY69_9RHOB|nr:single-stranded-DNA-specific exonuclease RecJ [Algicella marina]QHQ35634.1 single-stranded-DNA-specific exonuclease RecJ [Algicella marina]
MSAFLDVGQSLTGRVWRGPEDDLRRRAEALAQQTGHSEHVCLLLARQGVTADEAEGYLAPSLRNLMPDPSSLRDMDTAVAALTSAVRGGGRIAIFADYDVDGGASAALLIDWLRQMGHQATLYIPDRIDEGYGPNDTAMEMLAENHDLIICVDCGTLSHAPIAAAKARGAEVIVLDHHLGGETLPDCAAVVNPNRQDEITPLTYLCAAGVVFMALVAANRTLKADGARVPNLLPMLDLVALATVADVAPLLGLNRAFVRQGLTVMSHRQRVGLTALADVAGLKTAPAAYHLGFLLGPRVNAGGRIGAADLGARLLATEDPREAEALARRLDDLNGERRAIEAAVLEDAQAQAEARGAEGPLVWAAGEGWHPGVVGIVASRLKESFNRPAVVIGLENGIGKGSGRSVAGVDLGAAIATCTREGLLAKGGGHKMAAGLTVAQAQLEPAMARLAELLERQGAATEGPRDLSITGLLSCTAATADLISELETAGPFGAGVSAPRFALPAQRIAFAKRAGETHLRLSFRDATGSLDAIAFRAFDGPLGPALEAHGGRAFHLAGRLEIDDWGGRRKAKLRLEDAAPAD